MRDKLREVAAEAVGKAACRLVVCIGLFPGRARIEDIAIDAFDSDRDREAEIGVDTELRLLKLARQRGIEQCAGHLDRHERAGAMLAGGPARVYQPPIDPTPCKPPAKQIHEKTGMAAKE